ncbi:TetR/AcrR family transcriptional regulator [Allomesorhizobium alhagi]|uniref:TetR/AcrR family transcriptional regulator n=1 Tax=Allomesorhizobium alhagi TaxID=475067 RepID=UPI0019308CCC|nr:TetR/AcrR family transcriptional regulator C-terminal domain-containing protein [Mesorhizobium alhagi]
MRDQKANDPAGLMKLLWRDSVDIVPKPGRKRGLAIEGLIEAAIGIADEHGLAAMTIRGLAAALHKPTMTIYTYVSGKAELVPLMLDTIYQRMDRSAPADRDWRDKVVRIAEDNRRLFERHPWAADVSFGRPSLGPGTIAKYEYELAALEDLGVDDVTRDSVLTHILVVVAAVARASANQDLEVRSSAQSDEEWWRENAPFLALAFDPEKFPLAARIGAAAGDALGGAFNAEHSWTFAVDRMIDGIEALIGRGRSST